LRMRQSSMDTAGSRWEELVVDSRSRRVQDSEQSFPYRKPVNSEVTAAPVMLDSIHVINQIDETSTAAGTK